MIYTYLLKFIIFIIIFCIGTWEASVASSNQNTKLLTSSEIEAYAFTTIKAIINIVTSLTGCCLLCRTKENSKSESESKLNSDSQLSFISFGVSIWGIVMYGNMDKNDEIYGPFRQVITAEFIIIVVVFSLFGLVILITCCACIIIPSMNDEKSTIVDDIKVVNNSLTSPQVVIDVNNSKAVENSSVMPEVVINVKNI
jgi:hypothetical protein